MKILNELSITFLPQVMSFLVKALMGSVRVKGVFGLSSTLEAIKRAKGKAIYVTWHQRMSYHFYHLARKRIHVLISPSRDGEIAARLARKLGFEVVRGSSSRDAAAGLMGMIRVLKRGLPAGMLADGPLGPPRVAKIGTVAMASLCKAPIIPVVWGADNCWILNSWDRYMIPKPFSNVLIYYARPIWVPEGISRQEMEKYRSLLEQTLNHATLICDKYFGKIRPWSKDG